MTMKLNARAVRADRIDDFGDEIWTVEVYSMENVPVWSKSGFYCNEAVQLQELLNEFLQDADICKLNHRIDGHPLPFCTQDNPMQ